ncbi:MAG: cytidylate kinase-like family protein [Bacillota bacterium]|nr:cytidylate kinase-like family protein [Bacillota bacterium]
MANTIITLGREFGSGGRMIGKVVAEELGFTFYDKEIITKAAEASGMDKELLEKNDENIKGSIFHNFTLGLYNAANTFAEMSDISLNDRAFLIQSDIIKDIAKRENAVIVGRCADYVLRDFHNCFNVFIFAPIESRIERAANEYGMNRKNLKETITKMDRRRSSYYNYYTGKKWGKAISYHMSLDSGKLGIEKCVKIIKEMVKEV